MNPFLEVRVIVVELVDLEAYTWESTVQSELFSNPQVACEYIMDHYKEYVGLSDYDFDLDDPVILAEQLNEALDRLGYTTDHVRVSDTMFRPWGLSKWEQFQR